MLNTVLKQKCIMGEGGKINKKNPMEKIYSWGHYTIH